MDLEDTLTIRLTHDEVTVLLKMAERGWDARGLPPAEHSNADAVLLKIRAAAAACRA